MGNKRSGQRRKRKAPAAASRREQMSAARRAHPQGDLSVRAAQTLSPAARVEPSSAPAVAPVTLDDEGLKATIAAFTAHALSEPEAAREPVEPEPEGASNVGAVSTEPGYTGPPPIAPTRSIPPTTRRYPTLASMAPVAPQASRATEATDQAEVRDRTEYAPTEAMSTPSQPSSPRWAKPADSVAAQTRAALESHEASVMRELTATDELEHLDPVGADDEPQALRRAGRPLEGGNIVLAVAACHAGLVAVAALVGALLLIDHQSLAIWAWLFAGIAGLGGWLAYTIGQDEHLQSLAGGVLLVSQTGMLGWAFALVGPRASLLVIMPPLMLLALRTAGRAATTIWMIATLLVYIIFLRFATDIPLQPALRLDSGARALLDGALVGVGIALTLAGVLRTGERLLRAEAMARMRSNETRLLRARVVSLQRRGSEDAERLYALTDAAMRGHQRDVAPLDPALRPVAERLRATAERVAELRELRLEHQRLEAALRQVTRALERGWLGLRWTWPKPTGTPVDELMALLRAPRNGAARRAGDPSAPHGLTHLPTDPEMLAQDRTQMLPNRPGSAAPPLGVTGEYAQARTQPLPAPPKANAALRWDEWDEWRDWQLKQD